MNDTNTTKVFTLEKSGTNAFPLISTSIGFPPATYAIDKTKRITAGINIPIINPIFAIIAVFLVPPNCENVNAQNTTNTPINLITGFVFSAGKLNTYDSAPNIK